MTDPVDDDRVFERVRACLENLVGGSGHLSSYHLDRESFEVVGRRGLEDRLTEYDFVVDGVRLSEFEGESEDNPPSKADDDPSDVEHLEGAIVLDTDGDLVTDESGRVRVPPWRTLDPEFWSQGSDGIDDLLDELNSDSG